MDDMTDSSNTAFNRVEKFMKVKRKRVEILLSGGLGNQLFQYFAGLYLANRLGVQLLVNGHMSQFSRTGHSSWIFELGLPADNWRFSTKSKSVAYRYDVVRRSLRDLLASRIFPLSETQVSLLGYYRSTTIGRDEAFERLAQPILLEGYFQTTRYVDECFEVAQNLHFTDNSSSPWFWEQAENFKSGKNLVIHFRRGDYSSHKDSIGLLSSLYYQDAINLLKHRGATWSRVFVVTDDVVEAENELKQLAQADTAVWEFLEPPKGTSDSASLSLLTLANCMIIANSTFSWWGAKLSSADFIARPSKWFIGMEDPAELFPDSWIPVESRWV